MTATDPLAPLLDLDGVADAVARVRDALATVHNHPVNLRGWATSAAEAGVRAARASAALEGTPLDSDARDPVLAGAVRVADAVARLLPVWRTSPSQALARLHVLAASDLVPDERHDAELGRPRAAAGIADRLAGLAGLVTGGTRVPAPVLTAVVHGELLTLRPFGTADGVVARAAARLTAVSAGLDPRALAVPEVGHLRRAAEYREAATGFAGGGADGVRAWLLHCCARWEDGAREATSIADARS